MKPYEQTPKDCEIAMRDRTLKKLIALRSFHIPQVSLKVKYLKPAICDDTSHKLHFAEKRGNG